MNCYDTQPVIQFRLRRLKKEITNTYSKPTSPRHPHYTLNHRHDTGGKNPRNFWTPVSRGQAHPSLFGCSVFRTTDFFLLLFSTYVRRTHKGLHKPFNPASKCQLQDVTFLSGLSQCVHVCQCDTAAVAPVLLCTQLHGVGLKVQVLVAAHEIWYRWLLQQEVLNISYHLTTAAWSVVTQCSDTRNDCTAFVDVCHKHVKL